METVGTFGTLLLRDYSLSEQNSVRAEFDGCEGQCSFTWRVIVSQNEILGREINGIDGKCRMSECCPLRLS